MKLFVLRQRTPTLQLGFGFGFILLCLVVTLGTDIATSARQAAITDRLIHHLYPAREQAHQIVRLVLAIDDEGAWYILSHDPHQQTQLFHTYQQDVQQLREAVTVALAFADTPEQRNALAQLTHYFFGKGAYYDDDQAAFAQKRAGQELAASDNYVDSPFLPPIEHYMQLYEGVVEHEIMQAHTDESLAVQLVWTLSVGLGGGAVLSGFGVALLVTRSIKRLHQQIEEKHAKLTEANVRLQALATTDPLTGLPNHRAIVTAIEQELTRSERYYRPCALLFLDLDHFKAINDGYGHPVGDAVLREFATAVRMSLRGMDTLGRWGGEEFIVILPETDTEGARACAEGVRAAIAAHIFDVGGGLRLTCSVGVATYPFDSEAREGLVTAADRAMYGAKKLGRNQVRTASDPAILALETDTPGSREDATLAGTVEALTMLVEARDHYTGQHTLRVSALTTRLALALGLDASEAYMVGLAGRLHDVGKVAVPDAVLQKPAGLTEEEQALMRRHPVVGGDVISRVPSLRAIAPLIRAHHEQWNGNGYPDGVAGEQIPLGARIVAVADAYEAMTTDRPYQQARDEAWALAELRRCAGTQFDPIIVGALERVLTAEQAHAALAGI
jgi:diguanylate cyclase (GGDEF)-like protein